MLESDFGRIKLRKREFLTYPYGNIILYLQLHRDGMENQGTTTETFEENKESKDNKYPKEN